MIYTTHIIGGPPRFQDKVSLQLSSFRIFKVFGQGHHVVVLITAQQGAD